MFQYFMLEGIFLSPIFFVFLLKKIITNIIDLEASQHLGALGKVPNSPFDNQCLHAITSNICIAFCKQNTK